MRLVAAPDKFRGTATAPQVAHAIAAAGAAAGWDCGEIPLADGGEGLLDCFGGPNRWTRVRDPAGRLVDAGWRLDGTTAVIEMAQASGLALRRPGDDATTALTTGTGDLVAAALVAGARSILVGAGGSATTDGGLGAYAVLRHRGPFDGSTGVTLTVATDVTTRFLDAAAVFAPQKGATPEQVARLRERLVRLARWYGREHGVDVAALPGGGAAGGLAGGLAALGARIRPGFAVVAEQVRLDDRLAGADLVVTGEGRVDDTSSAGKVVGEVVRRAAARGIPVLVVAGEVAPRPPFPAVDLSARFGRERAVSAPLECVRDAVAAWLAPGSGSGSI